MGHPDKNSYSVVYRRGLRAIGLICGLAVAAVAQTATTPESTDKVDQIFATWNKPTSPGCALAVMRNGQIVHKKAYGTANLQLSVPIQTTSVFNVGSLSKQFTAFSVLLLAHEGKLTLDDDVRKHLPEVPDFGTPITLRHLIHHTSGLRDFLEMLEMSGWRSGDIATEKDVFDLVKRQRTLNHNPGEQYLYTNTGYVLLSMIVKRVSRKTLQEFTDERIFKPLGMTNTRFHNDHRSIVAGLVDAYLPNEGKFLKWMPKPDYDGSSNLFTTVEDLSRWEQNFYDKKVGGPTVVDQMLTTGVLNDGTKIEYAAGLFVSSYKGLPTVFQSGSTLGYQGALHRFPDKHFSVAVLCNVRGVNPDGLARRVADIYLADELKVATTTQSNSTGGSTDARIQVDETELSKVAGLYWNPATDAVRRVYVKDGKLMYFRAAGNETELAPLGGNRFVMIGPRNRVEISFKSSPSGGPFQLIISESGQKPTVQERVKPASFEPSHLKQFEGSYFSPEVNATYKITVQGEKLLFQTGNWGDFLLTARFMDSFANPEEMGSLMFTRDRRNAVSGFVIRSGKVKNLKFVKTKP